MDKSDLKKHGRFRKMIQAGFGILSNSYLKGFAEGTIYKGQLKNFCVPGMNCYSCPGALGACPIGAMQSVFDGRKRKFAFYVVGYLALIGLLAGRFVCGWLCLFGLLQELLYKIPTPKLTVPDRADRILRKANFFFLLVSVGTLEGGIPLVLLNSGMRAAAGLLFQWKFLLLVLCILASVFIYRPFCKYVCPLGAFYALFRKVSLVRMAVDETACVHCGACAKICKMNVDPVKEPDSAECIRCGECMKACPKNALRWSRK